MPSTQAQSVIDDLLSLPLGSTAKSFLDYLKVEAGLAENSILGYGRDLRGLLEFCESEGIGEIGQLSPVLIQTYLKTLTQDSKSESSMKRCVVAIRMFLRFTKLTGLIDNDFTELLEGPKLWQKLPTIAGKDQVVALLNAPSEKEPFYLRDKAMLELLYATGLRAGELAGLRQSDLNLDVGYLRCLGKGNRERVVPVGKVAIA
ncbi:MAG: tyrosine-type recombinase/integrase, partial [Planctomycetota bacterium]